jgi:hypothetical protein
MYLKYCVENILLIKQLLILNSINNDTQIILN